MIGTPQPDTQRNEIINKINSFIKTGLFTDFELRRLKQDAEKVRETDLAGGFSLLGMIAGLEKDTEMMHSYFKRALQQSGNNDREQRDYATALLNLCLPEDAYKYALKAYENNPSDLENLDVLINVAAIKNREEFKKYTDLWRENVREDHYLIRTPVSEFRGDRKKIGTFVLQYPEISEIISESESALILWSASYSYF